MVGPDSERRHFEEIKSEPRWMPLGRMLRQGTIGFDLAVNIPDLLERERPETIFDQELSALWQTSRQSPVLHEVKDRGFTTIADILNLSLSDFSSLKEGDRLRERLSSYLGGLSVTPHGRLLEAITGKPQFAVSPERESELRDALNETLLTLSPREQQAIAIRFGLKDGILLSFKKVGENLRNPLDDNPITGARVSQIEGRVLRRLRHPSRFKNFEGYIFSLPPQSLGRRILGAVFEKDLPSQLRYYTISDLNLSESILAEVEDLKGIGLRAVMMDDSRYLSSEAIEEIKAALELRIQADEERSLQVSETEETGVIFEAPIFTNNLIPEVTIPREKLAVLNNIEIRDDKKLSFAIRHFLIRGGVSTLGQLLRLSRDEFSRIRYFGPKKAFELGERVQELLDLPKEEYPQYFVALLLQESFGVKEPNEKADAAFELKMIKALVALARHTGALSKQEILEYINGRGKRVLGFSPDSWIVEAMVDYVDKH